MQKRVSIEEALKHVRDGMTIMVGGFLGVGSPEKLIDALVRKGVKDLTLICNDTAFVDRGVGKMVVAHQFRKIIASHIGTNAETGRQMTAGETEVELVPQGTLAEKIRCGGAGLGGFYTPTGVGTVVADGKETREFNGRQYLLEIPLRADVALVKAHKADEAGNLIYRRSARNFNPLMAMAADLVIAEVDNLVTTGEIDQDHVMTPGIFVNHLVKEDDEWTAQNAAN
ncbi:MAG TPA: acetate CoA-transferase subunit alpha [Firmicutes bacterium]|nr:acetate CoA-transferase subunit alpha [Bacillota bacterium]HAW71102.1 acetate CoA-transferase subunit alpha [Bacillota bacterium]HAZ22634.1 acetate CoA-transferase subunit alpha [Bacillota bacterium]HBE05943.1 acetate CoA-transferase subunit alpha [Bacillota bacterium]HBG44903.1 acetate CoA-transferase subunit alpha [Bacillota bacterium]